MRRTALIAAILAVLASGIGSAQAEAASPSPMNGKHCVTIKSTPHHQAATVCLYLDRQSGKKEGVVTFSTKSGPLQGVTVKVLQIAMNGQGIVTVNNPHVTVTVPGSGDALTRSWWDEPAGKMQVRIKNACLTWSDGDKACTGSGWLSSNPVMM
jgi:hypothetical protein